MSAEIVINEISEVIARFGIPKTITSNGSNYFTDFKFQIYCTNLGIRHLTVELFPHQNGFIKSAVEIIKHFFKKILNCTIPTK